MSQQPISVVGDGNIAGNYLNNVGNTYITHVPHSERGNGKALTLESCVAFDALLNAKERYPAPRCHVDTRIAVQGVATDWICRKGEWADKGVMWISGAPGVGKSAIVQTVCEVLGADDGSQSWLKTFGLSDRHVDGCHFFGRGLGNREKASFFPATIAYQLARSGMTFRASINQTIANDPSILTAAFPSQFQQLVLKAVKAQWWFQYPATIVIDALDECDNAEDQVQLLNLILKTVTSTRTRFLIASRPEHQIHTFFQREDVSQHTYHIRLDEESFNTSRDIEVFLRAEFARIRREKPESCPPLPNREDWPGNTIIILIRDDSDSQFMYPRLCIDYIDTPSFSPDQQVRTLLAARPAHAFSKLDALYHLILSRRSPDLLRAGEEALRQYQEIIMGILQIIIAWPDGPFSAIQIADILHEKVDVVQNIIRGPMRSLFKFKADDPHSRITLCHKSLRDYLLNPARSHDFCIPAGDADALFAELLSRRPPSEPYSREVLMGVLSAVVALGNRVKVPEIASFLDVAPSVVEGVVFGPTKALFKLDRFQNVNFSISSFKDFLLDANRAGEFFIPRDKPLDTLFIQILSRPPPSNPSGTYSREALMGVLSLVVAWGNHVKVPEIASFLDVAPSVVKGVVFGPAKALFKLDSVQDVDFSIPFFKDFLLDANRAGEYFIPSDKPDTLFTQILSCPPPSNPSLSYSREVLMGVLGMVVVLANRVKVPRIASFLDVAPSLVEGVVFGPTKALFKLDRFQNVNFSIPFFKDFLLDANRAGEYFIPSDKPDTLFTQILSCPPPSNPSLSYSREVLMGVLGMVVVLANRVKVPRIASFLDVAPSLVEGVVFGPTKALFELDGDQDVSFSIPSFKDFLLDASRAGEFFISRDQLYAHFTQILSRPPPSDPSLSYSREVLMGVLGMVVVLANRVKVPEIASFLDVAPSVVKGVVFGPAKALFKLDSDQDVSFSIPSFKDFLLDASRTGEFFISRDQLDAHFTQILSRPPPSDPSLSYSREVLMGVLGMVVVLANRVKVPEIASFLDVAPSVVKGVVFGPAKALFKLDSDQDVSFSIPSFKDFLLDASRTGEFFISRDQLDAHFTQILSRPPPSDPSQFYSREVLMGVLRVLVVWSKPLAIAQIASTLDVDPDVVKAIVWRRDVFYRHDNGAVTLLPHVAKFLYDVDRAGEYYIPLNSLNPNYASMYLKIHKVCWPVI